MHKIIRKILYNSNTRLTEIEAPLIARKAKPGQFVIIRVNQTGERIPLTISDTNIQKGTISVVYQMIGKTTMLLGELEEGDSVADIAGPLGVESELDSIKKVCVVGGGLGCAIAFPQAKYLFEHGAQVDIVAGFKNRDSVILEEEMREVATNLYLCTDDGSYGISGFTTNVLEQLIESGNKYDVVIAIGPTIMMKLISSITKKHQIKTIVSLNPIMVDGTGMCGSCRVTINGETKFACVDGPDFDAHQVDFDELITRLSAYKTQEAASLTAHVCKRTGELKSHG